MLSYFWRTSLLRHEVLPRRSLDNRGHDTIERLHLPSDVCNPRSFFGCIRRSLSSRLHLEYGPIHRMASPEPVTVTTRLTDFLQKPQRTNVSVKLRMRRMGRKKIPVFSIVATDSRNARDGRYIEDLGRYYPLEQPAEVRLDEERVIYWLDQGAQPSNTVRSILRKRGVLLRRTLRLRGEDEADIETAVAEHLERMTEKGDEVKKTAEMRRQEALERERERVKELEEEARKKAEEERKAKEEAERKAKEEAEAKKAAEAKEAEAEAEEAEAEEAEAEEAEAEEAEAEEAEAEEAEAEESEEADVEDAPSDEAEVDASDEDASGEDASDGDVSGEDASDGDVSGEDDEEEK